MKKALLIIDIQNEYFPGGKRELHDPQRASKTALRLLSSFRENGWPIFHIQHISKPGSDAYVGGTKGAEIHEDVKPLVGETVIQKNYPNLFRDTGLLENLQELGITELVIAGMMTHMCVESSVRAAFDYGFRCTVIKDACATKDLAFEGETVPAAQVQKVILAAMNGVFAQVMSLEEFLERKG